MTVNNNTSKNVFMRSALFLALFYQDAEVARASKKYPFKI